MCGVCFGNGPKSLILQVHQEEFEFIFYSRYNFKKLKTNKNTYKIIRTNQRVERVKAPRHE